MRKSVAQKYTLLQVKCKDIKRVGLQAGPFGDRTNGIGVFTYATAESQGSGKSGLNELTAE
jgi:hypothetical protein